MRLVQANVGLGLLLALTLRGPPGVAQAQRRSAVADDVRTVTRGQMAVFVSEALALQFAP